MQSALLYSDSVKIVILNVMDVNAINLFLLAEADNEPIHFNMVMNIVEELAEPLNDVVNERRLVVRNKNYFEVIIPQYTDMQFKEHFRMSRITFENLIIVIGNHLPEANYIIPLPKKILFTLWLLGKQESFLAVGDRFEIGCSTGHYILKQIIGVIINLIPEYIIWPNLDRQQAAANIFQQRSQGFPGVIGAIDGCHINCKQPVNNPIDYYNRKGNHSIILQGICDHQLKFIDVFIGMPGRMHDARVFRNCNIFDELANINNVFVGPDMHLIGDSAYPLMPRLMTPFRNTGHLNQAQIRFNYKLSSIRSVIERAFGLLKGKFRRLKYLDIADFDLGNAIIGACCVLHNFIILNNDVEDVDDELQIEDNDDVDLGAPANDHNVIEAQMKRNNIVNIFQ